LSLQGESTFTGLACVFVRLTGCNLRCSYCDTAYAFAEGTRLKLEQVLARIEELASCYAAAPAVAGHRLPLVELTGGEPLLQPDVLPLMTSLCDRGFTVLIETSGALDLTPVDPRVRRIMDLKCPSSGESSRNRWENLNDLRPTDEIKFVIGTREDYTWTREIIARHHLATRCPLLISWVQPLAPAQQDPSLKPVPSGHTPMSRRELAEAMLADALPARLQVQLHKLVWPPDQRGV
jgi:7-carboxy-7-deazaguanine synthase